jgi:RNA polymerase sigma-70 factor (ECF subfamily)
VEKQFINLLNQHGGILYKVCKIYCNDLDERKDLYQEIVLQLWRAFPGFQNQSNVSTWLYRVAMNTAISNFRKGQRKRQPTPFSHLPFPVADLLEDPEPPDRLSQLYAAIEQLSVVEKAFVLLYLEDKSYEEMAAVLGISKSNVGVKLSRIKTKLEVLIKEINL